MDLTPQAWAKCDAQLRRALARLPHSSRTTLPVMIAFAPAPAGAPAPGPEREDRARYAREREAEFEARTRDVVEALAAAGALDISRHWVGAAISGRLPPAAIEVAARRPDVLRLDLIVPRSAAL